MVARLRQAFFPSGAKDDRPDAVLLLDLLTRHRDRLRPLEPDTVEMRSLQFLVEQRRQFVDEKTRQKNRLTARFKLYFPHVLAWFDDIDTELVGKFLRRWPTLEALQRSDRGINRSQQPPTEKNTEVTDRPAEHRGQAQSGVSIAQQFLTHVSCDVK